MSLWSRRLQSISLALWADGPRPQRVHFAAVSRAARSRSMFLLFYAMNLFYLFYLFIVQTLQI